MKSSKKRFNFLKLSRLRFAALSLFLLFGSVAALAYFAPAHSAFSFLTGEEKAPQKQTATASAEKSDANKKASAPSAKSGDDQKSPDGVWREIQFDSLGGIVSDGVPATARALELDKKSLVKILNSAPDDSTERLTDLSDSRAILHLPLPNGEFMRFRIADSPVMERAMAEKFPEIKSYRAQSIDDLRVSARISFSPRGLHATILTHDKTITIQPAHYDDANRYVSYYGEDFKGAEFNCGVTDAPPFAPDEAANLYDYLIVKEDIAPQIATGATLRTYRFAVATTQEYYNDPALGGGSYVNTVASINNWVGAVNLIYERELAVKLLFFTDPKIVFTAEPDGLTNGIAGAMAGEIDDILEAKIGLANYDIGHVFGKDGDGGVAGLGVTCASNKAKGSGATGLSAPLVNAGSLIVLAHEIGHQFGAPHTWNACKGGARVHSATAYEVGSGSTIMGYGGTCDNDNLLGANDARFHAISLKNMNDHIARATQCAVPQNTNNIAPVVDAGAGYTIPKLTPFALTASATDANDDVKNLTYTWEQFDAGGALYGNPPYGDQPNDPETTTRPIFRAYSPTSNPTRVFPSLEYILNNANIPPETVQIPWGNETRTRQIGEKLPSVGRTLKFRVTARDNRSGGGGTNDDDTRITVAGNAGPFAVTAPNTAVSWTGGTAQTVTWSVNNTNIAPVNAANVKISLSTDGGQTFPVVLANSAPNKGSFALTVPNGIQTQTARVKIEAVGNIFFDISDANFAISNGDSCPIISGIAPGAGNVGTVVTISGSNFTGVTAVKFGGGVSASSFTVVNSTTIEATVPGGATSGAITVSKPSCSDRQTAPFSVCTSSPQPLAVDDGNQEAGYSDKYHANRLTPTSYPATLTHVQIYFHNGSNNAIVGEELTILTGTNADGDANINNTAFQSLTANVKTVGSYNTYALAAPLTITSGDFVIGYKLTTGRTGAGDNTAPKSRSYYSNGGSESFALTTGTNYMIRGQYSTGCAANTTISPGSQSFNASAGNGSIAVAPSTASTAWTATSNDSWITIISGASGTGNGTLVYAVAQNSTGAIRTGTITVAGQTFTVTQTGCVIGFSPSPNTTISAAGGIFDITVSAPAGCSWTATSNSDWITLDSGTSSGSNNGTIKYSVLANSVKTARTGTVTIAGQTLTVTQTACPGSATMIFDEDEVGGNGSGTHFVQRLTPANYPATLTHVQIYFHGGYPSTVSNPPTDSKVMILAGKNEDGDANINNSIQQTFEAGTGTVRDAYTTFALPTPITITSGDFVVGFKTVSGAPAFPLSLEVAAPTRGRSYGSGDGLTFFNDTNADYKIRGQYNSFCPDGTISPASRTIGGGGGSGTVSVTASGAWTATSNDAWITVNSGASGNGNGTVAYTVAQNSTGAPRTGTITIAGQVFIVTQDACSVTFALGNATVSSGGGNFTVSVPAVCGAWTATSNDAWITINSGASGTGSGTVAYTVAFNSAKTARSGTITIAGQTFTITQNACPDSTTMIYDDDVVNFSNSGGYNVVRLTPTSYPATLKEVQIYLNEYWGTTGRSFNVLAGKNTDGDADITGSIQQTVAANSGTIRNAYVSFPLTTPITITQGDFVVGFQVATANGFFPLAAESTAPTRGRSYWSGNNGATFVNDLNADYKIRGKYQSSCPDGTVSSSTPPTFNNSGGSGKVNVTADGAWTAFSNDSWITVAGDANASENSSAVYEGNGNGTVIYMVAPNDSGVARSGSMTIAGLVYTVNQGLAPTAAPVSVSGRILSPSGRGISNAQVTFTAPDGSQRNASTNAFGYYRVVDLPTGQNYVVTAYSKRYRFTAQALTLNEFVSEFNITAEP